MPLLFSYGTLRDPEVQRAVFGRELSQTVDELLGFTRRTIEVCDAAFVAANGAAHAIVQPTGRVEDRIAGSVLEVSNAELAMSDAYEPVRYRRIEAHFASGRAGWVYADATIAME